MGIILSRQEAIKIANEEREKGKKIVLANGCFDLIHQGHIVYLREAKKFGDILFVAINSDTSVKRVKGKERPIQGEEERALIVSSIKWVDYVFIFKENNVEKVILEIRPHFHAKGGDYTPDTVPEKDITKKIGAKTVIAGSKKINSSTDIISKILVKYQCDKNET